MPAKDDELSSPTRRVETTKETAAIVNVRGFLIGVKIFKGLCVLASVFVGAMAVCLIIAIGSAGSDLPLDIRLGIGFGQTFNVLFAIMIILALLNVQFLLRYVRVLKYWAGVGVFMMYTGFQLFSYTQTSLGMLRATTLTRDGFLKDTDALETASEVAAFTLLGVGCVFFLMACMCLQRLEHAPTVDVHRTTVHRTTVRDLEQGMKSERFELDKQLLQTERAMPVDML